MSTPSSRVGGAGGLEVRPGVRVVDDPDFPAAIRPGSLATINALEQLKKEPKVDWFYLAPSADMKSGPRTGHFRLSDQLLTDANVQSHISVRDFAVAMIDELERPAPIDDDDVEYDHEIGLRRHARTMLPLAHTKVRCSDRWRLAQRGEILMDDLYDDGFFLDSLRTALHGSTVHVATANTLARLPLNGGSACVASASTAACMHRRLTLVLSAVHDAGTLCEQIAHRLPNFIRIMGKCSRHVQADRDMCSFAVLAKS